MKKIIVAYDKNFGIGANNDLLWGRNLPSDLRRFKQLTSGNAVIMGRNTFESIGRPLPGRQNIVISRSENSIDGVFVASSLKAAFEMVDPDKEAFVIGGGQIYALAIDAVDQIVATEVDAEFKNATVFFPSVDLKVWREISRESHVADGQDSYGFDFVIYERR